MACGDTYAGEVVTVDGYSPENPYGALATVNDYIGWRGLAEAIYARLDKHWQQLGGVEPNPFEFWNANVEAKNALAHRVDGLPSPLFVNFPTIGGHIDDVIKVILDMNCFRERVLARLVELGEKPEELPDAGTPDPAAKPGDWIPLAIGGVAGVAAIYVAGRYVIPKLLEKGQ